MLSDQQIALNQASAWKYLFNAIQNNTFQLNKKFTCELHGIAAKEEALIWGGFRNGSVMIAGTEYQPPSYSDLDRKFDIMISESSRFEDIYDVAIYVFLMMARTQFSLMSIK